MRNDDRASGTTTRSTRTLRAARTRLEVPAIRLAVHLGCEADERAVAQVVDLSLAIDFATPPDACASDALADTVCYAELAAAAREHCAAREFRLIERMAAELREVVRARLPNDSGLVLTVIKLAPPVPGLAGGVRFTIDDREGR
ncbi:FolB domain-containing protein [Candidatus Binatia bacterium]|nr:FolB domain-containing protein [Candidatus Binatia bacterium]